MAKATVAKLSLRGTAPTALNESDVELPTVLDSVCRLDSAVGALELVSDSLWRHSAQKEIGPISSAYFALQLVLDEIKKVTNELREYPLGFAREVAHA